MTDKELFDYSGEHLIHELQQLYGTAARLSTDPTVLADPVLKNALIESFASTVEVSRSSCTQKGT